MEEVEQLLHIARDATAADTFEQRLSLVTERLLLLVPATCLSAVVIPADGARPEFLFFKNNDPDWLLRYAMEFRHVDPMRGAIERPTGRPVLLSEFVSGGDFGREAFTSDFLGVQGLRHILGIATPMPDGACLAVGFQRERGLGDFTRKECELLRLVSPDLARAVFATLLRAKVGNLLSRADLSGEPRTGLMVFDPDGDVIQADAPALAICRMLGGADGCFPADLFVSAVRSLMRAPLSERQALERTLPLGGEGSVRVRLQVTEGRNGPEVIGELEVTRPDTRPDFAAIADRLCLTQRERQVAELVLQGLGNRHIGFKLGMSEITVGTHLTKIYRKAGASGRTDFVRLVLDKGRA
jgi:DNA-binding NarL/FixJ family response regulator